MFSWIIFSFALLLLPTIYADSYDPGRLTPVTLVDTLDQPMELQFLRMVEFSLSNSTGISGFLTPKRARSP